MVRWTGALLAGLSLVTSGLRAQVMLVPPTTVPAAWERFTVRVANPTDTATVGVMVRLPDGVRVLGVDAPPGWTARYTPGSDSESQMIEWAGGRLERGEYRDFPFLGRVNADLRSGDLVFPVRLTRATGSSIDWAPGGAGAPPTVRLKPVTTISAAAAFALAAFAFGLSVLGIALAVSKASKG